MQQQQQQQQQKQKHQTAKMYVKAITDLENYKGRWPFSNMGIKLSKFSEDFMLTYNRAI